MSPMVDSIHIVAYSRHMIEIRQTAEFEAWLRGLKDRRARARIYTRLERLESGLFGDVKYFDGIGELRIDYGPGYRAYFLRQGNELILLLCGGDKRRQQRDIARALELAKDYKDGT